MVVWFFFIVARNTLEGITAIKVRLPLLLYKVPILMIQSTHTDEKVLG